MAEERTWIELDKSFSTVLNVSMQKRIGLFFIIISLSACNSTATSICKKDLEWNNKSSNDCAFWIFQAELGNSNPDKNVTNYFWANAVLMCARYNKAIQDCKEKLFIR